MASVILWLLDLGEVRDAEISSALQGCVRGSFATLKMTVDYNSEMRVARDSKSKSCSGFRAEVIVMI